MGHGFPDFSQTSGAKTIYQLTDMAELAARLGSIVTFDRRGDVVFIDSFENDLLPWQTVVSGDDSSVDLSLVYKKSGSFSARLNPHNDPGNYASIYRRVALPSSYKFGFEASISFKTAEDYVKLSMIFAYNGEYHSFRVRYAPATGLIEVYDGDTGFVEVTNANITPTDRYHFTTFKLVVDLENDKYVRLLVSEETIDLSAYESYIEPAADKSFLMVEVTGYTTHIAGSSLYVDDVIVTQNEP